MQKIEKVDIATGKVMAEYKDLEKAAIANYMKIGELLEHLHGWIENQDDFYFRYVK